MNDNQKKVIDAMRKYIGKNMKELQSETGTSPAFAGHCKAEIQQLVSKTIGLWLPRNDPNPAKWFQWEQGGVRKLAEEEKLMPSYLYSSTKEAMSDDALEIEEYEEDSIGLIMQVLFDSKKVKSSVPCHTAIITGCTENDMTWLDVNYKNDNVCREHTITHKTFNDMCIAFRLYSIL